MSVFLIDNSLVKTYADLLYDINNSHTYKPVLKTDSLYEYFLNFLIALISDSPLTLIDSTSTHNELEVLGISNVNGDKEIAKHIFNSVDELLAKVFSSSSEICIFTSGTTGQPKMVKHSIMTLTRSVKQNDRQKSSIWAFAYSPTHMAGLQVFFQAIANQNQIINVFNKSRDYVYECIDSHLITHISATPTFYRLLLPAEKEFRCVKRLTLGGEKSSEALYENLKEIFPEAKITNIYASTEAGSLFASNGDSFTIPQKYRNQFKVCDNELLIHKSMLGKSASFKFQDDYYHSGDLIEWIDEANGLFKFIGRKNELLNIGGYKVNPEEVEDEIDSISGVQQCKVYGRSNSVLGTILCADIKKDVDAELTEKIVRSILSDKLQDFKIPRKIRFVDSFDLTSSGKLQRK